MPSGGSDGGSFRKTGEAAGKAAADACPPNEESVGASVAAAAALDNCVQCKHVTGAGLCSNTRRSHAACSGSYTHTVPLPNAAATALPDGDHATAVMPGRCNGSATDASCCQSMDRCRRKRTESDEVRHSQRERQTK